MIHRRPERPAWAPRSSASTASSGNSPSRRSTMSASARASISVTRFVGVPLNSMRRGPVSSRRRRSPAARATSTATRRSWDRMRRQPIIRSVLDKPRTVPEHDSGMNWKRRQSHLRAALGRRRHHTSRIRPGAPPGTLVAAESGQPPAIQIMVFGRDGFEEDRVDTIDAALARVVPGVVSWINVDGLGDPKVFARLGERFGLHPLALEDVLNVPQRPKVERFDKHMFLIMRTMRLERSPEPAGRSEADVLDSVIQD